MKDLSDFLEAAVRQVRCIASFRACHHCHPELDSGSPLHEGMSHGFEIADAISFKEDGYCWVLGHPELDSGSLLPRDAEFGCMQPRSA